MYRHYTLRGFLGKKTVAWSSSAKNSKPSRREPVAWHQSWTARISLRDREKAYAGRFQRKQSPLSSPNLVRCARFISTSHGSNRSNMPTAYYSCKKEHWTDYTFQTERKRLGLRDGVRTHVRNIFRVQKTSKVFFFFILSSLILLNFMHIYEPILSHSYCIYFPITYHIRNIQFSITASKIQSSPLYSPLSVAAITLLESDAFWLFSPVYS